MNEPPPSAQCQPNPAGDQPVSCAAIPSPRRRFRKLRLLFAACGVVLAAFLLIMLASGRGPRTGVQIQVQKVRIIDPQQVWLYLAVTNREGGPVVLSRFDSEVLMNGLWLAHYRNHSLDIRLGSGQASNFVVNGLFHATAYRGQLVWYEDATTFQKFRRRLHETLAPIFKRPTQPPGGIPADRWHTNAFGEFRL